MDLRPGGNGLWVVRRPQTVAVMVVDLCIILVLIAWGLTTHRVDPIQQPMRLAETALPFLIGWLLVSPIAGAFSSRAFNSYGAMAVMTAMGWLGAALVGIGLRSTDLFRGGADPVFVFVMVATGLAVMVPWRIILVLVGARLDLLPRVS